MKRTAGEARKADEKRRDDQRLRIIRGGTAIPYVGEGADGCRRTAQVLRDEIATLATGDPRADSLEAEAQAWDDAASWMSVVDRHDGSIEPHVDNEGHEVHDG